MILSFEVTAVGIAVVTAFICAPYSSLADKKLYALLSERQMMQGDITGSVITQLIAA